MQSTVEEHAASPERDQSCASCHMPRRSGDRPHLDHGFRVQGDPALLRSAVRAEARREGDRVIDLSLAARGAGHAVPTGDMFRRLEVHATAGDGPDAIRATPVVLSRELVFEMTERGPRRRQLDDRRLPASGAPREARLVFPRSVEGLPIRWEVVYHRMGPREAALFGVDLDGEAVQPASPPLSRRGTGGSNAGGSGSAPRSLTQQPDVLEILHNAAGKHLVRPCALVNGDYFKPLPTLNRSRKVSECLHMGRVRSPPKRR